MISCIYSTRNFNASSQMLVKRGVKRIVVGNTGTDDELGSRRVEGEEEEVEKY